MILLPDVNVLVAIAWPEHTFHATAIGWFDANADDGWATCPITELGFLRISANAKVVETPVRPKEAATLLTELQRVGDHHFWPDDVRPSTSMLFPLDRLIGHRQVTDAYLLTLCGQHDASLATFDRRLAGLARGLSGVKVTLIE